MGLRNFWTISRAQRAAISTITPMVELSRARLGTIPPTHWQRPYIIGFLAMLISAIAKLETRGRIGDDDLGMTQTRAWQAITRLPDDRIGEDICLMSAEEDPDFMRGCADAARLFEAIYCRSDPSDPDVAAACADGFGSAPLELAPGAAKVFGRGGVVAAALWTRYFEEGIY